MGACQTGRGDARDPDTAILTHPLSGAHLVLARAEGDHAALKVGRAAELGVATVGESLDRGDHVGVDRSLGGPGEVGPQGLKGQIEARVERA